MSTLVYKFGLPFGPVSNEEGVRHQMFASHRYRNLLTACENQRRQKSRDAEKGYQDLPKLEYAFQQAKAELRDATEAVKVARAKASRPSANKGKVAKKRQVPEALTDRVKQARAAKKKAQDAWHERRGQLATDPAVVGKRDAINEAYGEKFRLLRRESAKGNGLFWGSYLLVERAFKAARTCPLYRKGDPCDVKRVFWEGTGTVGLQIQSARKFDLTKIFEPNRLVWIEPVDEKAWHSKVRGERRRLSRTVLHLRVGSDEKGGPVWAEFPMIMHRPFPKGARVTWVAVHCTKIGPREQWSVDFTLDTSLCPSPKVCGVGRVAVNLGWRIVDGGIRVATYLDDEGNEDHLVLGDRLLSALHMSDHVRSRRDVEFDAAKKALADWVKSRTMDQNNPAFLPGWLHRAVTDRNGKRITLGQWRSQQRLAALARRWKANRFHGDSVGDEAVEAWKQSINEASKLRRQGHDVRKPPMPEGLEGYAALEAWRYHDWHLWIWQESMRKKSLRRRKSLFRNEAARLAALYGEVVLHKLDLRDFQRRQRIEAETAENETARSNRHTVAVAELRDCLVHGFKSRGGSDAAVPSENITQTCSLCGMEEPFEAASQIMHVCSHCGERWDQDVNACRNILLRCERPRNPEPSDGARNSVQQGEVTESKWQMAQRKANERRARLRTARNEGTIGAK
jgi:Putative transposase DNA-binding domain